MKKLFVSVGLIAAGSASLQGAYAPDWNSMEASMWRASGTLRGFYDDNYATASSGAKQGSLGFEVTPQLELNIPLQQTELGMRYAYGMYYYQKRADLGQDPIDQTHQFDLWLDHAFTERWQARMQDSFVIGQEPELLDPTNTSRPTRASGNNIRNTGSLTLNTTWTRLFSTSLNYQNSFFDYQEGGITEADLAAGDPASLAGILNRIEQSVSLDLRWIVGRETTAFLGGSYAWVNYTGNEPIAYNPIGFFLGNGPLYYYSNSRDSRSYFGYFGLQRSMLANLSFIGKAGVQYTDNYNDPLSTTSLNPYVDLSLIYTYLPGSYAQLGFTQTENATDQVALDNNTGRITLFTESSTVYTSLNHKLTPKLLGTIIGRWQHSVFSGGFYNKQANDYYNLGLNLSYTFNPHFSADVGYNFDDLVSKIPGYGYARNRVYLGVTAAY
jgi:hypothetical protein